MYGPELHVIQLEPGNSNQLIHALQPCNGTIKFASTLTDIQFKGIGFNPGKCTARVDENHEDFVGCLRCLGHALACHAEKGNVLQKLCFNGCVSITEDNVVMELSDLVGEVVWSPGRGRVIYVFIIQVLVLMIR